jgi:aminoglycoside phosphotransferase (APT) family kinase protein
MTAQAQIAQFLVTAGLARADEPMTLQALTGGVSSDIWRVDLPGRAVCVKRALPRLKVAAEWNAPLSRNAFEWAWLCFAAEHTPAAVPRPLAHDKDMGLLAMDFLEPARYPVWKNQLLEGHADPALAAAVGTLLGRLHAASAHDADVEAAFDATDNFFALRLEPYLLATAERHPGLAPMFQAMTERLARSRIALVHGDVSPKNILAGPGGPVFLDAECAWFGDPAFDLAFCLNHLLLKCVVRPAASADYLACFDSLAHAYLAEARWEPCRGPEGLEARTAALLPMLFLARVDGKSPVEYLTMPAQHALVREVALPLIARPVQALRDVADRLSQALAPACSQHS